MSAKVRLDMYNQDKKLLNSVFLVNSGPLHFFHLSFPNNRLGVNYFEKIINNIQLHWKLFNSITITITWLLSKVINYILLLCQM